MMATDFFSNSSSVKAGAGREGGGVGALSRLTAEKNKRHKLNTIPYLSSILISECTTHTINLSSRTSFYHYSC